MQRVVHVLKNAAARSLPKRELIVEQLESN